MCNENENLPSGKGEWPYDAIMSPLLHNGPAHLSIGIRDAVSFALTEGHSPLSTTSDASRSVWQKCRRVRWREAVIDSYGRLGDGQPQEAAAGDKTTVSLQLEKVYVALHLHLLRGRERE